MKKFIDLVAGAFGITSIELINTADVTEWVQLISSVLIALATCGVTVYRLIRDRDNDKNKTPNKEGFENDGSKT